MPEDTPAPESIPRSGRELIDIAIRENRTGEYFCYGLIALFVVIGLTGVIVGMIRGDGVVAVAGTGTAALFWPALRRAERIRETNILIRLLEMPLSAARTSREASTAIIGAFRKRFDPGGSDANP